MVAGTVKVWDPRQKDFPVANMEPAQGESTRDCWTVAFGRSEFLTYSCHIDIDRGIYLASHYFVL